MIRSFIVAALLVSAPAALAQAPGPIGPLDARNNLSEIAAGGPTAQAAARINLGITAGNTNSLTGAVTGTNVAGVINTTIVPTGVAAGGCAKPVLNVAGQAVSCVGLTGADLPFGTTTGTVADGGVLAAVQATANAAIPATQRGAANGVATLDSTTHVQIAQLPVGSSANAGILQLGTVTGTAADGGALAAETTRAEAAEGLAAPLASPSFTGAPVAPTPATTDNSTKLATTAFVKAQGFASSSSIVATTGDIAIPAGGGTATLPNVNGAPNTSSLVRITTNAKGQVTATSAPQAADITTALGFTPYDAANPAGYVTSAGAAAAAPVQSVGGRTGAVTVQLGDIAAATDTTNAPAAVSKLGLPAASAISTAITQAAAAIPAAQLGAASGVATLDSGGHVPVAQLPVGTASTAGILQLGSTAGLAADGGALASAQATIAAATSVQGTVVAAGTTQATCTQLTAAFSNVNGGGGGGVCLQAGPIGIPQVVSVNTALSITIWPAGTQHIGPNGAGASVVVQPGWTETITPINSSSYQITGAVPNIDLNGFAHAVTQAITDNTTALATDAFVRGLVNGYQAYAPATGATLSPPAGTRYEHVNPSTALATLTQAMPPSPFTGDEFCLMTTQPVTAVTFTGTVNDAPSYLAGFARECFKYDGTAWNRLTDIGIPPPAQITALANGAGQISANLAASQAALTTIQSIQTALDTLVSGIDPPPQASATVAGILTSIPSLALAGTDASGNIIAGSTAGLATIDTVQNNVVAAGTTQATCTQLTASFSIVNGGGGGGVCLQHLANGQVQGVVNNLNVGLPAYPLGTDSIQGAGAGVAVIIPPGWVETFETTNTTAMQPRGNFAAPPPASASCVATSAQGTWQGVCTNPAFGGTGAITVPSGTTGQEPGTPVAGMWRFNSTLGRFEGYNGTAWNQHARLSGDAFTGAVSGPTPATTDNSTLLATTAFVDAYVASQAGAASGLATLDAGSHLSGGQLPGFTGGDATSAAGSKVITFNTVNSTPGTCGDATHVCQGTTNNKGLVTAQAPTAITFPVTSVDTLTGGVVTEHCDLFTASGTWTKQSWASWIVADLIGAGGGGGEGGTDPGSSITSGGGGGGGGAHIRFTAPASAYSATVAVTINAAGVGSTGNNATNGGSVRFGSRYAYGGGSGGDGAPAGVAAGSGAGAGVGANGANASGATPGGATSGGQAGTTGVSASLMVPGQPTAGAGNGTTGAAGNSPGATNDAPTGGASGGGITAAGVASNGGAANAANGNATAPAGGVAPGGAGANGVQIDGFMGMGASGGAGNAGGVGGAGGNGIDGGGGGGGGAGTGGGGHGGAGGGGEVLVCQRATA